MTQEHPIREPNREAREMSITGVDVLGHREPQSLLSKIQDDLESHGEVHVVFENVAGDVEARLGTTRLDYRAGTLDVHDGDHYHTFNVENYISHYRPMDVYEGGNQ